jgi:hypothetical protein
MKSHTIKAIAVMKAISTKMATTNGQSEICIRVMRLGYRGLVSNSTRPCDVAALVIREDRGTALQAWRVAWVYGCVSVSRPASGEASRHGTVKALGEQGAVLVGQVRC